MKALWNGTLIACSDDTIVIEGNHYFPARSLVREHLRASATRTRCAWKGEAHYYDVVVADEVARDAAWTYPDPLPAAQAIRGHVAFWRGVEVVE